MDFLRREITSWYSHRTGLEMPIVQYGHWGHPLLLLPTAQADFLEYERFGLIGRLARHLEAGRVRIFSIDSINRFAWLNDGVPVHEKAARQAGYAAYVEEEVVPFIRNAVRDVGARIAVGGASFGAFHAANQFFRRPELFDTLLAMSGLYDLSWFLGGYSDENAYLNNPSWYVPNLPEDGRMNLLRHHAQIHILAGQGAWELPHLSRDFSGLLASRGIPHNLDLWGHDVPHDWPTWLNMFDHYIDQRLGW